MLQLFCLPHPLLTSLLQKIRSSEIENGIPELITFRNKYVRHIRAMIRSCCRTLTVPLSPATSIPRSMVLRMLDVEDIDWFESRRPRWFGSMAATDMCAVRGGGDLGGSYLITNRHSMSSIMWRRDAYVRSLDFPTFRKA